MNTEQMKAAMESMKGWLAHPQELGKSPAKIECAGSFEQNGMRYYIFKYKKGLLGKWLLGVCGGYEGEALGHCGHVFSLMEEFLQETAVEKAKELAEKAASLQRERTESVEKRKEHAGTFVCSVLLEKPEWDKEALLKELKEAWQIEDEPVGEESEKTEDEFSFVICHHNALISVGLMPAPIPHEEAKYHAPDNYMWQGASEAAKKHTAHLLVAVMGRGMPALEAGKIFVKTTVSCCKQPGVLAVYANEIVYQPEFYTEAARMVQEDDIPLLNLIWFGLYRRKTGVCGYTNGMVLLGFDEMEVIDSTAAPSEIRDFLINIAGYVIDENVILRDGETIGFSAEQKLPITKSMGVAVDGNSLKIKFPG